MMMMMMTTLVCSSEEELLEFLGAVKEAIEKKGLLLNTKKTKITVVDERRKDQGELYAKRECHRGGAEL